MTTLPNRCTWAVQSSVWPPLPTTPPPENVRWVSHRVMMQKHAESAPIIWRVNCAFKLPTLAPLNECRVGDGSAACPSETPPGSPWARSTGNAWVLDEGPTRFCAESIVGQLCALYNGGVELSAQAQSSLGIDPFLYQVNGALYPPPERIAALRVRLMELARKQPDKLHRAVHFEKLGELLGQDFTWVRLPKTKTHGDNRQPPPW